jgi:probable ATP-dependent RNA helicase DDX4
LPILNRMLSDNDDLIPKQIHCLVVAPTRELVIQIFDEARKFAHNSVIKVCKAYGGTATRAQGERIESGCHVLVATPGRLMDFVEKSIVSFCDLKYLVRKCFLQYHSPNGPH